MSKSAAQAYSRVANSTASPRDIEAQALLMAANKLQDVMTRSDATVEQTEQALMFNRKLWTVFIGEALSDSNPQPIEVRQKIANIAIFVLSQTLALQAVPQLDQFKSLIDINRNIAAGLSGRA
jgi:flagellar protein FlaF